MLVESLIEGIYCGAERGYPAELARVAEIRVKTGEWNSAEWLVGDLGEVILKKMATLGELGVRKGEVMVNYVAFGGQSEVTVNKKLLPEGECLEWLKKMWSEPETVGVMRQFELALEVSKGEVSQALIILAMATRVMARNYDQRLMPGIKVGLEEMLEWKSKIANFDFGSEDNTGDNYHFWQAVLAGYASEMGRSGLYGRLTGWICDVVYQRTAELTELLRYSLAGEEGETHGDVDRVGYEVGRTLARFRAEMPEIRAG